MGAVAPRLDATASPSPPAQALALVAFVAAVFGVAAIGGLVTASALDGWYDTLEKPSWTPPGSLIGRVWTALYALMAVSGWLVWRVGGLRMRSRAFALFAAQLGLNLLWSILFFGLRSPGVALVEIVVLWAAILACAVAFWRHSRTAALLLVPYLAWVAFASYLTFRVWRLNA